MDLEFRSPTTDPVPEELVALSKKERLIFSFVHQMNQGRCKRFWTFCQKTVGASWIHLSTYNILKVYGIENFNKVTNDRPILLVANHRSFFDMFVVSTVLFRMTGGSKKLFFPVRAKFFYDSILGSLINFIMGWWSMYPPLFTSAEKREFDKFSMRLLVELCRNGSGHIIGLHPEGKRNFDPDPYSLLRAQPGVGKIIKEANPQVIPVFVVGLCNSIPKQILRNWTKEEFIRVHFGTPLDLSDFISKRDHVRTYKEIADFLMQKIAELAEQDRCLEFGQLNVTNRQPQIENRV
jgi:1-acyl-sn-glycerol-3-phosphate acyltransferase